MRNEVYQVTAVNADASITKHDMTGVIIGPFGVAAEPVGDGWFRFTHLHTGLAIHAVASRHRGRSIVAAYMVKAFVPRWEGSDKVEIAKLNKLSLVELKQKVLLAALIAWCEGEPDTRIVD